jgi:hypothetical protein
MKSTLITSATGAILLGLLMSPFTVSADPHHDLPPGLQKKVQQGKPLPPGWQKRYHKGDILDNDIYGRAKVVMPLDRDGLITVSIEGTLFRLHEKTRQIIEILAH